MLRPEGLDAESLRTFATEVTGIEPLGVVLLNSMPGHSKAFEIHFGPAQLIRLFENEDGTWRLWLQTRGTVDATWSVEPGSELQQALHVLESWFGLNLDSAPIRYFFSRFEQFVWRSGPDLYLPRIKRRFFSRGDHGLNLHNLLEDDGDARRITYVLDQPGESILRMRTGVVAAPNLPLRLEAPVDLDEIPF